MAVLVVMLPPRERLAARPEAGGGSGTPGEFVWALSEDGVHLSDQGRSQAALLPRADGVVAVLDPRDVSWHQLTLPKAPPGKLRAALGGLLEEALLAEPETVHLALPPEFRAGEPTWVAVTDRAALLQHVTALETAGLAVERVVPALWPGDSTQAHFFEGVARPDAEPEPFLALAYEGGMACMPLAGSLAKALVRSLAESPLRWTAHARVAAAAEAWLESPVHTVGDAELALQATRSLWNLRQFDLAPRRMWSRAWRDALKHLRSPAWRPARLGLAGLAAVHLIGLNAWAWAQRQALAERRQEQVQVLQAAHPQVRLVVDAPLQMQRETDALRAAAGRPGDNDIEPMLSAAATAWPAGQPPVQGLRFEPGQLSLVVMGWTEDDTRGFADRLRPLGYAVQASPGRIIVQARPATPGAAP
ncbi:MAG: hypothetical protein RI988_1863 [Pseudomonadota bacterium]